MTKGDTTMLKSLKIKNFKSYKEEAFFSFEGLANDALPQNYIDVDLNNGKKQRLLHSAVIFGANASGKTNVLWALDELNYLVTHSRGFVYSDNKAFLMPYEPFAFDDKVSNEPTEFTVELLVKQNLYRYFIRYDQRQILLERLCLLNNEEEIEYFTVQLSEKGKKIIQPGAVLKNRKFDITSVALLPNHLLLSELGIKPVDDILDIYNELADMQIEPSADAVGLKQRNKDVANEILKDEKSKLFIQLKKLIHIADIGIEDIRMDEEEIEPKDIFGRIDRFQRSTTTLSMRTIHTGYDLNHQPKKFSRPLDEFESMGTKHLFSLGARVLKVLDAGGLLAYDEMNMALHPSLVLLLVSMFNNQKSNPKHAQLVFTTHDASIVGDNQLRVDQVWFAEKNADGESELFSAQDFDNVSIVAPIEQWYRSGLFGARPSLGSIDYIFENDEP